MTLSRRQKLTIISLLLYWPGIFILSHIPLARVPGWVIQVQVSDKILHCLGYLILVFLLWFAISPYRKVNWRRATVWWVLFAVVWYGVFDEWLQAYVGRNADVGDFLADLAGTLTGLIALSIFPFWPAALGLTAAIIFVTTNFMRANPADLMPVTNAMFLLFGYGFFTLVWTRCMYHLLPMKAPQPRWLIGALSLPMGFLLVVEVFSAIAGNDLRLSCVIISAAGIGAVVFTYYITAFRNRLSIDDFRFSIFNRQSSIANRKSIKVVRFSEINLGIVCPMANEHSTAVEFIRSVLQQCRGFRTVRFFAVFDNACKDGTFDLLKDLTDKPPELQLIWSPENKCVVDAYVRGYRAALDAGCDWILEMDAGFSHQPAEIPQFFDKIAQGHDCVFGSRFCKGGGFSDAPPGRYLISRWGSILTNLLLGTKLKDMTSGFEMFTGAALRKVLDKGIKSRGHFFQTEIKVYCRNFRTAEVPIHYRSPSQNVNAAVLIDAFSNLFHLFRKRLAGSL